MRKSRGPIVLAALALAAGGCGTAALNRTELVEPAVLIEPGQPIAIVPFETESALSNFGAQVSDEVIVALLEHAPHLKIMPAAGVRTLLTGASVAVGGLPDAHAIHDVKDALRCRYLMTGNLYASIGDVRFTQAYSNRIATGSVTVRLVDCDSLDVVWAKHIESSYSTTLWYSSATAAPTTYLTDGQLLAGLVRNLGQEIASSFYRRD